MLRLIWLLSLGWWGSTRATSNTSTPSLSSAARCAAVVASAPGGRAPGPGVPARRGFGRCERSHVRRRCSGRCRWMGRCGTGYHGTGYRGALRGGSRGREMPCGERSRHAYPLGARECWRRFRPCRCRLPSGPGGNGLATFAAFPFDPAPTIAAPIGLCRRRRRDRAVQQCWRLAGGRGGWALVAPGAAIAASQRPLGPELPLALRPRPALPPAGAPAVPPPAESAPGPCC